MDLRDRAWTESRRRLAAGFHPPLKLHVKEDRRGSRIGPIVASRSPRVFSAQFHLLLVTSQLEDAEARHRQAEAEGHRLRAWRAARELDRLWDAVESQRRLLEPPAWRVADPHPSRTGLEPEELLHARLQGYVQFEPRSETLSPPARAVTAAVAAAPVLAPVPEPVAPAPLAPAPVVPDPVVPDVEEQPRERRSWTPRLQELFAVGSLVAIAVSAAEIAANGIGQRPGLIAAELCALAFSPFAILLGSDR
jgi:hypothetical protein